MHPRWTVTVLLKVLQQDRQWLQDAAGPEPGSILHGEPARKALIATEGGRGGG